MINSSERSDILVFNCYLYHVRFLSIFYVCSTKIGKNSDISTCFEDFVSQALGFLKRFYAAELRYPPTRRYVPHQTGGAETSKKQQNLVLPFENPESTVVPCSGAFRSSTKHKVVIIKRKDVEFILFFGCAINVTAQHCRPCEG